MTKVMLKTGKEIYISSYLKTQLDSLVYNLNHDWDFVIIITGDGMVRTGKSVLAMTVSAYLADKLNTKFTVDNVFFDSVDMIDKAQQMPKNSVIQYDEAREGLSTSKRGKRLQEDLIDFFNECGQLNHIFILVLPDFFGLNWELATNRSELLLNVYRTTEKTERNVDGQRVPVTVFGRGHFEFFNRSQKADLYWSAKRKGLRKYNLVKHSFHSDFTGQYPIDEKAYRAKKRDMLLRFSERHKTEDEKPKPSDNYFLALYQYAWKKLLPYQKDDIKKIFPFNINSMAAHVMRLKEKFPQFKDDDLGWDEPPSVGNDDDT